MSVSSRTLGSLLLSLHILTTPVTLRSADLDWDGIDDTFEETLARGFMPMIWYDSNESCPDPGLILFHVRPFTPGGSTDTLSITYSVPYYEDCGLFGHDFDLESFAVTLYPLEENPYGYGVFSIRTWAHRNTICQQTETKTYDPPVSVTELSGDTLYNSWEEVFVAANKHGFYLNEETCDGHCGVDDCERYRLMNDSQLVPSDHGQFFYLYNIGEINDHLIERFDEINQDGFAFDSRYVWNNWWMDENYLSTSTGPSLPVYFNLSNFPYPNPIHPCSDNSIGLDLGYRSVILMQLLDGIGGEILRDEFIGEFCAGNDVDLHLWDGYDNEGDCLSTGPKIVRITAYRGGDSYDMDVGISIADDPADRPEGPTNLDLSLVDDHVLLEWVDNANDEEWFFIERREGSCAYEYLTMVEGNPGTGTIEYEDHDILAYETYEYRVFATGDGGYSGTSNSQAVTIPDCSYNPHFILSGPSMDGDTIYRSQIHPVSVEVSDPNCTFTQFSWTVSGNDYTEPGTIIGTGNSVLYLAPNIDCDQLDFPPYQNKIDVITSYQGDTDSSTTGWFTIHCPPPDTSGCPFLYVWDGEDFLPENNLLPLSEILSEVHLDYYLLRNRPKADDQGHYLLEIREDSKEHSFLDAVELRVVDHPPSVKIGVTQDGRAFGYREITPPLRAVDSKGSDQLEALRDVDGITLHGRRGYETSLSFPQGGPGIIAMYVVIGPRKKGVGPIIIPEGDGNRADFPPRGAGLGLPRHLGGLQFFDISSLPTDLEGLDLSLAWRDEVAVDWIGMITGRTEFMDSRKLTLQGAAHSIRGDVGGLIRDPDNAFAELRAGERIRLSFSALPPEEGMERDFILISRGYYTK